MEITDRSAARGGTGGTFLRPEHPHQRFVYNYLLFVRKKSNKNVTVAFSMYALECWGTAIRTLTISESGSSRVQALQPTMTCNYSVTEAACGRFSC